MLAVAMTVIRYPKEPKSLEGKINLQILHPLCKNTDLLPDDQMSVCSNKTFFVYGNVPAISDQDDQTHRERISCELHQVENVSNTLYSKAEAFESHIWLSPMSVLLDNRNVFHRLLRLLVPVLGVAVLVLCVYCAFVPTTKKIRKKGYQRG